MALGAGFFVLAAVAIVVLGGASSYTVTAQFQNASQLVNGNLVQVAGRAIGKVSDIELTDDGQAAVTLEITDDGYTPLSRGTLATVRQASLSGVANRYIDLRLGAAGEGEIPDGGTLDAASTTSAVDLDQLFNTFDPTTAKGLQGVIQGFARSYEGEGEATNAGWLYLNPSLAASARLFREVNRDTPLLERFIVASSNLVSDVAERRDEVSGLVDGLARTTQALSRDRGALAESVQRLPAFMRRSNTTFAALRTTLDDLDPLVAESRPAVRALRPVLRELRPLARDARPTLRDLSRLVRTRGADNDLVELLRAQPELDRIATRTARRAGEEREGALPASTRALLSSVPQLGFARPYAVELTGWFDDFSHSGLYDALGGASRPGLHVNAFTLLDGTLQPIPPELRAEAFDAVAQLNQRNRCPGALERGGIWKPTPDYNCDERQVPPGR